MALYFSLPLTSRIFSFESKESKDSKESKESNVAFFGSICILYPTEKIKKFIYKCDKKFHLDQIIDYLQVETKQETEKKNEFGIILVSGKLCQFYRISKIGGKNLKTELLSSFEETLPNKHRRGGQSSARFGRIHDQTVERYIKKIVQQVEKTYSENGQIKIQLIFAGPADIKNRVAEFFVKKVSTQILDTAEIHVTQTIESILENVEKSGWIYKFMSASTDQAIEKFNDLLIRNSDFLVFGEKETKACYDQGQLDYLFLASVEDQEFKETKMTKTHVIFMDKSHEFIKKFGPWSGILKYVSHVHDQDQVQEQDQDGFEIM